MGDVQFKTDEYYFGKAYDGSDVDLKILHKGIDYDLGTAQGIQVVTQTEMVPRFEMGTVDPIGVTYGKRMISGTISLSVINQSTAAFLKNEIYQDDGKQIQYLDQLPPIDIVITANNGEFKAKKTIKNVNLFNNSSAVGLSTLGGVEQCQFIAEEITPLEVDNTKDIEVTTGKPSTNFA